MRFSNFVLVGVLPLLLLGCQNAQPIHTSTPIALGASSPAYQTGPAVQPNTAVLWVRGMACPQCSYNVDRQLLKVPGVEKVKVDMSSGKVVADLSPGNPPTREQLAKAIQETGFTLVKLEM